MIPIIDSRLTANVEILPNQTQSKFIILKLYNINLSIRKPSMNAKIFPS